MRLNLRGVRLALACAIAVSAAVAAVAGATIISTGGAAQKIAPPPSVALGALESDTKIQAFDERQCVTLASDLAVDITAPGTYNATTGVTGGVIPAGTKVSSAFLHADPVGQDPPPNQLTGSITKDTNVLGLIVLDATLDASDAILGAPGTTYPTGVAGRGLELTAGHLDQVTLSGDRRTVTLAASTQFHADQVRVVEACPQPPPGHQGCTPGFWKQSQHFDSWVGFAPGDKFETVFGVNAFPGDPTLLAVLNKGGGGINALGRQAVAALLNAASPDVAFGMSTGQVIALVQNAIATGTIEAAKNQLEALNQRGCPLS